MVGGGHVVFRIIPARAGFTSCCCARAARVADHPRSRGVYFTCLRFGQMPPGSSPLARGLRQSVTVSKRGDGIIPARAGFTRLDASSTSHEPDHPRSRGVYRDCPCPLPFPCGSSPLARGLLGRIELVRDLLGIIPARAGFTVDGWALTLCLWDHPRSRGVYGAPGWGAAAKTGSSPLARGLRGNVEICHDRFRIIPARAGFTSVPAACPTATWDHPRSRGVYRTTRFPPSD